MERCEETDQKLNEIFNKAMELLSVEVTAMIGRPEKTDDGYQIPVKRNGRVVPLEVKFLETWQQVSSPSTKVSSIEKRFVEPTIVVQWSSWIEPVSFPFEQSDEFVNKLKCVLETQAKRAHDSLQQ